MIFTNVSFFCTRTLRTRTFIKLFINNALLIILLKCMFEDIFLNCILIVNTDNLNAEEIE